MTKPIESINALYDAKQGAKLLHGLLSRESDRITPGQWVLAEELFVRVYKDHHGKHYAVADYLKEQN